MKSLLLLALGLARTVVLGARIEAERIVVSVRPYKREQRRCPVCGRACGFYDMASRGAPRLWRAMDLARSACYLEYAPCRVRCPEHGVRTEAVPWARHGARFTRDFEDWVAWLAVRCTASAVSELARVEWHSVGGVCRRVYAELEAARGASRFDGVRRIGIDETSYKKGHKYVTVVVGHDRGCLVWAHEGTGKDVLNLFLDGLAREQRRAMEVVAADGARRIGQLVKRRCPNARWVMDPFRVVQWMNGALDAVRCGEWNAARAAARAARPRPEGKRGRPAKGELPPEEVRALEEEAASIKGSRYALVKNPEDLTDGQRARLEALKKRAGSRLVRAWELKEDLRAVFRAADGSEAAELLDDWMHRAAYCKIAKVVAVEKKVRRRRDDIIAAVELGISNGRVEAINILLCNGLVLLKTYLLTVIMLAHRPRVSMSPYLFHPLAIVAVVTSKPLATTHAELINNCKLKLQIHPTRLFYKTHCLDDQQSHQALTLNSFPANLRDCLRQLSIMRNQQ